MRFVVVTLDGHRTEAFARAREQLAREVPGLELELHVGADFASDPPAADRCRASLREAHFVLLFQLFQEEMAKEILPTLLEHRDRYDSILGALSTTELVRLTKLGRFSMADDKARSPWSPVSILKKLRGSKQDGASSGERQMQLVRTLPSVLRFIPGVAQDVRAYMLSLQYWLSGSDTNIASLVKFHLHRYAAGPRAGLRESVTAPEPEHYPEHGLYHPTLPGRGFATERAKLPARGKQGRVGLLVGRSYILAGNTGHYRAVIEAFEARGLTVVPAFAAGLDSRPAIDAFFKDKKGHPTIDALVSLTGFSLVGGPAYNDSGAAQAALAALDVPYISLPSLEFQDIGEWETDPRGLNPLQATLQVAIPELDGATNPLVFAGRRSGGAKATGAEPMADRIDLLARRVERLITLRQRPREQRKLAIILFNFPPNAGNTGSAAYLAVFPSLQRVLAELKEQGYRVDLPESADALRRAIVEGNAGQYGMPANVHAQVPADEHVRKERHLADLEKVWGPAPGKQLTDGRSLFVLGRQFGNVFVGVQPAFGWEGDPMRLLFEGNFAPTHAFVNFYRWLREDYGADAVLHFGTHGALEFMPGKQVGLSAQCWPERLIGDLPNVYLYASNNSSEGTLAKRRGAATLVSYLTPPLSNAGLYRKLAELKATLDRFRATGPDQAGERATLAALLQQEAAGLELATAEPAWAPEDIDREVERVRASLLELEYALIPLGLHTVGEPMTGEALQSTLQALEAAGTTGPALERAAELLSEDHEIPGLLRALDARFVPPAPGGDLLRSPQVLPTGRNLYGFDPYRVPSAFAVLEGQRRAAQLLAQATEREGGLPETIAMVLWGTDNMKTEGTPLAIALALLGAAPRFDGVGRLVGARLVPLAQLGRPRIDVVLTLSGIFRDLLPLQTSLLAEAALLAAQADEPADRNFVRKHALETMRETGCDLETAALRVFSNADGAYGSNVNLLIDSGRWNSEDELAEQFLRRKSFAYGPKGPPRAEAELFQRALGTATVSFQNLDSVELGTTDIDQYVESLGGMNRLIQKARGAQPLALIGDHTGLESKVRTLEEQVALETRTRLLNPKWFEAQLAHGYEGVRNLSGHVTTTLGWSATGSSVPQWVYTEVTETFVLDATMRERLAALNPTAAAGMAQRLLEANDRGYWRPDPATLDALRQASAELDDRLEGVVAGAPA